MNENIPNNIDEDKKLEQNLIIIKDQYFFA